MFGETFRPRVNGVFKGTQGQNTIIDIESEENLHLILATIYAPSGGTWQKERKSFFSKLEETQRDLNCENLILARDFNCVLNNDLDRGHAVMYRDQSRNSLKHLLTGLNLEDAQRLHNPDEQVFTHHSHLGSVSHIDRIYTPQNLRNSVLNTEITPCAHSDHDIVSAFLTFGETPRGKGVWHLNCDILNNNEFTDAVSAFWPAWREHKKSFLSLTEWWDEGKRKIKILAESFTKRNKEITVEIHKKEKLRNAQTKANRTGDACHARLASDLRNNIKTLEEKTSRRSENSLKGRLS